MIIEVLLLVALLGALLYRWYRFLQNPSIAISLCQCKVDHKELRQMGTNGGGPWEAQVPLRNPQHPWRWGPASNHRHSYLNFSGKKHMNEFTTEDYKKYKQEQNLKVHGWFLMGKPTLSINDVNIIKQIQVIQTPDNFWNYFCLRSKISIRLWTETRPTLHEVSPKEENWTEWVFFHLDKTLT